MVLRLWVGGTGGGRLSRDVLVGRVGKPEEIASLIAYVMREEAGYITGANYDINGGLHFS